LPHVKVVKSTQDLDKLSREDICSLCSLCIKNENTHCSYFLENFNKIERAIAYLEKLGLGLGISISERKERYVCLPHGNKRVLSLRRAEIL